MINVQIIKYYLIWEIRLRMVKIQFLASNSKYLLLRAEDNVLLVNGMSFEIVARKKLDSRVGCLQYNTGIVCLCRDSMVIIQDMIYERQLQRIQTDQRVQKMWIMKNILIIVSKQRILIYDLSQNKNLCYLPTYSGKHVFLHENYYQLQIFYPKTNNQLINKSIWTNKVYEIQQNLYENGLFSINQETVILSYENTLKFYEKAQLLQIINLEINIKDIVFNQYLAILTEQNKIFSLNKYGKDRQSLSKNQTEIGHIGECWKIYKFQDSVYYWNGSIISTLCNPNQNIQQKIQQDTNKQQTQYKEVLQ